MKKVTEFQISFEGESDSFSQEETVRGTVVFSLTQQLQIKGIWVTFHGMAETTLFVGDYDRQREVYFSSEQMLFGSSRRSPGDLTDMGPGDFQYPFSFKLPPALPGSFFSGGDESGRVKYSVEAVIHRPGKLDFTQKRSFQIRGVLDLNSVGAARQEVRGEGQTTLSCLGLSRGVITAALRLPRRAYALGERVSVQAHVVNDSRRWVKRSVVALLQLVALRVHGSSRWRTQEVCRRQRGPVAPGERDEWEDDGLVIPADLPPSRLAYCSLIDVHYALRLSVEPAGLAKALHVPLSVVIGTLPLREESSRQGRSVSSGIYDYGTKL